MTAPIKISTTLPTRRLLGTCLGGLVGAAALWSIVTWLGPWPPAVLTTGLLALGVTAVISTLGLLAIRPWKERPILAWGGLLIALSLGRIVATLGVCLLLYFVARLPASPLLLGALAGLIPVLVGETTVTAGVFRRLSR